MAYTVISDPFGTPEGKADDKGHVEYTRQFMVLFDAPVADVNYVGGLPEIPFIFSSYPSDFRARVKEVSPKQSAEDPSVWTVTVTYASVTGDEKQKQDNPLAKPPRVSWGHARFQEIMTTGRDDTGKTVAVQNAAGDPFDPPPEVDASRLTLNVIYNLAQVPSWALDYQDAVNDRDISIEGVTFPARTLKANVTISEWQVENDINYRQVTVELEARDETWDIDVLNRGFYYKDALTGKKYRIRDDSGRPYDQPQLLSTTGQPLSYYPADTPPNSLTYRYYPEKDYSVFNLPP